MAEKSIVHMGENSPEKVALDLFHMVASVEGKLLHFDRENQQRVASRQWILDTYAECLKTVVNPFKRLS